MPSIHWTSQVGDDFSNKLDWTGGRVPGTGDDAILDAAGPAAFVVTSSLSRSVGDIQTGTLATLDITAGLFVAAKGSGAGANAGTILVADGAAFAMGGALVNTGGLILQGAAKATWLEIGAAGATLSGGGAVSIGLFGRIYGAPGATLTNVDNTIAGAGVIGLGQLTLVNQARGVIDASLSGALIVSTAGQTVTNGGLMEATGAGGLIILAATVDDSSGGVITAAGGQVQLQNADVVGGQLMSSGAGRILFSSGANLFDGTKPGGLTNDAPVFVGNGATLATQGLINNSGLIESVGSGSVTIGGVVQGSGGGVIEAAGASGLVLQGAALVGGGLRTVGAGVILAQDAELDGTASIVTNQGRISIADGESLLVKGAIANAGTISLAGTASGAALVAFKATLSGGGRVVLGDNAANAVTGVLTNINDMLSGAGEIDANLTNQAAGVVDATGVVDALDLEGSISNAGLIEATGAAGLTISGTVNGSSGGAIRAIGVSKVTLQGADIVGGALQTFGNGQIVSVAAVLDGSSSAVTSHGVIAVGSDSVLTLRGVLDNAGSIRVGGAGVFGTLLVSQSATLAGGGAVLLSDNRANIVTGPETPAATLTNVDNTISGAGQLGDADLVLVNQAAGVIDGTGIANALVLDTGANSIANAGLIEATRAGGMTVASAVNNTGALSVSQGKLTLEAAVSGTGNAIIAGGVADFLAAFSQSVTFTGTTGVLELADSQGYSGDITGFSTTGTTSFDLGDIAFATATVVYNGTAASGVLTVQDGSHTANINLEGNYTGSLFTLSQDALGGTDVVALTPSSIHWAVATSGNFLNKFNWVGAKAPGPADDAILDAPGVYTAGLWQNALVGDVQTAASATLDIGAGLFVALHGSGAGANAGAITVTAGATFRLSGAMVNPGVISLQGAPTGAFLQVGAAGLTLSGGGQVTLVSSLTAPPGIFCPPSLSTNHIAGVAGATLTNVDNTIAGAGWVGLGQVALVNQAKGVIDATAPTDLVIDPAGVLANAGLIESTGTGGLYIVSSTVNDSSGGVIAASGTGTVYSAAVGAAGQVYLWNSDIIGGELTSSGTGGIHTDEGANTFDGATAGAVVNDATVIVNNNTSLTIEGAIANMNLIEVEGGPQAASLIVGAGGATLTGQGQIIVTNDNLGDQLIGATAAATLTNIDNTISGNGQLGAGDLTLVNEAAGVIDATGASAALLLDTGASSIANAGLIEATGAGGLTILNTTVDNQVGGLGVILAGVGSTVNLQGTTILGGTLEGAGAFTVVSGATFDGSTGSGPLVIKAAVDIGDGQTLAVAGSVVNGGAIVLGGVTLGAVLAITGAMTLSGAGQVILGTTGLDQVTAGLSAASLTNVDNTISGAGQLGDADLVLVNQAGGVIDATGASAALVLAAGTNTIANAGLIEATGAAGMTVASAVNNTGTLAVSSGTLTLEGAVTGAGSITIAGGVADFLAAFSQNVTFTGTTGGLELANSQGYSGDITGFSTTGTTSFDLGDIAFATATVSYNGTTTSGVLTVQDGSHIANINLEGNYTTSVFTLSQDAQGGTIVVDPTAAPAMTACSTGHRFIAAVAAFGVVAGGPAGLAAATWPAEAPALTTVRPRDGLAHP